MLTVKLSRKNNITGDGDAKWTTKIVEATEVDVHQLRIGELAEVATTNGESSLAFYITDPGKPRPEGFADSVEFWQVAYIENSAGATTHIVRI